MKHSYSISCNGLVFLMIWTICISASFGIRVRANIEPKADLLAKFKTLCDAHPTKATYVSVGKSVQGNDIWAFCFGNPRSKGVVMWDGQLHGGEDAGSEIEYLFAEWLFTNTTDSEAKRILDMNYIIFIPVINIDTYNRQNMRRIYTFSNGTTFNIPYGVNLNRNFVYRWGESLGTDNWNSTTEYKGLYQGSEPETQAMRNAFAKFKPRFYVNTHQGGGPWLGRWYENKNSTLDSATIGMISQTSLQMNVTPYRVTRCGAGGLAIADAGAIYNASAWLIELNGSGMPSINEANIRNYYYPKCLPIFAAMCQLCEDATVIPTTRSDVNDDGIVNIVDITTVARTFDSRLGSPRWDPATDVDGNGIVDLVDIAIVARDFGEKR